MAEDMMNFQDWIEDRKDQELDQLEITLEQELERERNKLRSEEWKDGELYYTINHVDIYNEPKDTKMNLNQRLMPNTLVLISKLSKKTYRHGFR